MSLDALDGLELVVDSPPPENFEDHAFHVYLLGHAAAEHRIKFTRIAGTDRFDIHWIGRLALVYAGDHEYKYGFVATLIGIQVPLLQRC